MNKNHDAIIASCLFNGQEELSDAQKITLIKLMRGIIPGDKPDSYKIPASALMHPEFPGNLAAWDEAIRESIVLARGRYHIVGQPFIDVLENATGKTLAEVQDLHQSTRPLGGVKQH